MSENKTKSISKKLENKTSNWKRVLLVFILINDVFLVLSMFLFDDLVTLPSIIYALIYTAIIVALNLHKKKPEDTHFGKEIMTQFDSPSSVSIENVYSDIDDDIEKNGKKIKTIYIGKRWIVGKGSMWKCTGVKVENIRIIYPRKLRWSGRNYYYIDIVDKNKKETTFFLSEYKKGWKQAYSELYMELPNVMQGEEDYLNYLSLSPQEQSTMLEEIGKTFDEMIG